MSVKIEELTSDDDRKLGQRRICVTHPDEEERVTLEMTWESNRALPGDAVRFQTVDHPPSNASLQELLLELLCAVRRKPYSFELT